VLATAEHSSGPCRVLLMPWNGDGDAASCMQMRPVGHCRKRPLKSPRLCDSSAGRDDMQVTKPVSRRHEETYLGFEQTQKQNLKPNTASC
jgi:hypothetical protein